MIIIIIMIIITIRILIRTVIITISTITVTMRLAHLRFFAPSLRGRGDAAAALRHATYNIV